MADGADKRIFIPDILRSREAGTVCGNSFQLGRPYPVKEAVFHLESVMVGIMLIQRFKTDGNAARCFQPDLPSRVFAHYLQIIQRSAVMPMPVIGNSAVDNVYRRIEYDCFAQAARFRQQQAGNIQQAHAANGCHAQINRNLRPHALFLRTV